MAKNKKIKSFEVNNAGIITNYTTNNDYACFDFYGLYYSQLNKIVCKSCNYQKESENHNYCPNCGKMY